MSRVTCCCFDLETSHRDADSGVVLCAVVKPSDGSPRVFRADAYRRQWLARRADDRLLLLDLCIELARYDLWYAQNGRRFDLPFLRTRLAHWDLEPLPSRPLVDPLRLACTRFRLGAHGLDRLARLLERPPQAAQRGLVWDEAALDDLVRHCRSVVGILERVLEAVLAPSRAFPRYDLAP
jgi:hypothetical protein